MNTGIYKITNTKNNKFYIGSATSFKGRWRLHLHELRHNKHPNEILQRSWNKYGEDSFLFEKLLVCAKDNLIDYEQRCLDNFNPDYNICKNARSPLGVKRKPMTAEHRAKISASLIGNTRCVGYKHSAETRAKVSAANMGNKKTLGYKHTQESKDKMSKSRKGRHKKTKGQPMSKQEYMKRYGSGTGLMVQ